MDTLRATEAVLAALAERPEIYMIGIAGIPGSGKSTLARTLASRIPGAVVIPMDGYHFPRCQLDAEGLRRRGAPHTFDRDSFRSDMESLRRTRCGVFPAFDHAEKDPKAAAIHVTAGTPLVVVEGIYVLMRDYECDHLFDLRVFLDCDADEAIERLTRRHVECGVEATMEAGRQRAMTYDLLNAAAILANGCRERAHLVL
ncbi:MAG: AAA family ATPase [Verrucomicrobiales bacterium]